MNFFIKYSNLIEIVEKIVSMLSNKTKYAIKALLSIYRENSDKPVHICKIAENENIPQKFLELIMLDLKRIGVIDSKRGKGGGYFLIQTAEEIKIGDVIRFFEGPIALLPCASVTKYRKCDDCQQEDECSLRILMQEVRESTAKILDKTSLLCLDRKIIDSL